MSESNVTELTRISKCKTAARGINTIHTGIFSILSSLASKGAFYVNCAFNWVAGMAVGGWLLAFGSLFNDFSMKDYLQKLKSGDVYGSDKTWCMVGFSVCAANSLLCLSLCMFMFHDMASSSDYYKAKVLDEQEASLTKNLALFDKDVDPVNYASVAQDLRSTIKEKSQAKIDARAGKAYAPEHAIFEKTRISKTFAILFMCFCVFFNALISTWIEREERTQDDLDENGNVVRKNHGVASWFRNLFGNNHRMKPVVRVRSGQELAA